MPTPSMVTWSDIGKELGGVSRNSLYAICRKHEDVKPIPAAVKNNELYFEPEEAQKFIDWYKANHKGGVHQYERDDILVGYEELCDFALKETGGTFALTINGAGYWRRHYGELRPIAHERGPNGGRAQVIFLKKDVKDFLVRRGKIPPQQPPLTN